MFQNTLRISISYLFIVGINPWDISKFNLIFWLLPVRFDRSAPKLHPHSDNRVPSYSKYAPVCSHAIRDATDPPKLSSNDLIFLGVVLYLVCNHFNRLHSRMFSAFVGRSNSIRSCLLGGPSSKGAPCHLSIHIDMACASSDNLSAHYNARIFNPYQALADLVILHPAGPRKL